MGITTATAFLAFLGLFVVIGVYSSTHKKTTTDDYLVASRDVNPWLAALSAVSTNNSGFMFLGMIGTTFTDGISSTWLMIGWIGGDWMAWYFVHRRVRHESERRDVASIPSFIAGGRVKPGDAAYPVAALAGVITLVFLSIYASAQLLAGGKALYAVSGWPIELGVTLGAVIVAAYCFSGGIRASIWTDAAQSIVMLVAMALVVVLAVTALGGAGEMWSHLASIDNGEGPNLTDWTPSGYKFGLVGYALGWFGAGFGAVGQPHVMIRAMAVDSEASIPKMRRIYLTWYILFTIACIGVGLAARALLEVDLTRTDTAEGVKFLLGGKSYDPELALLTLTDKLSLAGVLVGLVLAGLFAATISTADSQILSCSAALTQDIVPAWGQSRSMVKSSTLLVALFALAVGLVQLDSVFGVVTLAWATLAAGLGPLLVVRALGRPIAPPVAIVTMLAGIGANLVWRYVLEWQNAIYDVLPGMLVGFATYAVLSRIWTEEVPSMAPAATLVDE